MTFQAMMKGMMRKTDEQWNETNDLKEQINEQSNELKEQIVKN